MVDQDANRRGGLYIGFGAGAPRLEGRRRDQERELREKRPVQVWLLPLLARGLQAGLRLSPRLLGTVYEAPAGQRGRAAGGGRRIMSTKDERAREILRGFKLYPPGSGAGPGGLGRRPLAEETGRGQAAPGGHPRRGRREGKKGTPSQAAGGTRRGRRGKGRPERGRGR